MKKMQLIIAPVVFILFAFAVDATDAFPSLCCAVQRKRSDRGHHNELINRQRMPACVDNMRSCDGDMARTERRLFTPGALLYVLRGVRSQRWRACTLS